MEYNTSTEVTSHHLHIHLAMHSPERELSNILHMVKAIDLLCCSIHSQQKQQICHVADELKFLHETII